ncbi:MAG TPA: trypsin-like serine protease [Vicinamibacterales bacterium]|jgi:hypothetical protein|nr:trypsin-like serine protease [Vicinamibacterales bacterium]
MRPNIATLMLVLPIAAIAIVAALGLPSPRPPRLLFRPVTDIHASTVKTFLQYGHKVPHPERNFPASLSATFDVPCSATLVGADSLMTSGHCVTVAAEGQWDIAVEVDGNQVDVLCTSSPVADIALCQLMHVLNGIEFDVVSRDAALAGVGRSVLLTGWGETAPSSLITRWFARLKRRVGFGPTFREGTGTIEGSSDTMQVLGNWGNGGRVVGEPGDSGGAAYAFDGRRRVVIGVNQCGGSYCAAGATDSTTVLTSVTYQTISGWIKGWADGNHALLCGYTSTQGCRP